MMKKGFILAVCMAAAVAGSGLKQGIAGEKAIADRAIPLKGRGCEIMNFSPIVLLPAPTKRIQEESDRHMINEFGKFIMESIKADRDAVIVYESKTKKLIICDGEYAVGALFKAENVSVGGVKEKLEEAWETTSTARHAVNSLKYLLESIKNFGR